VVRNLKQRILPGLGKWHVEDIATKEVLTKEILVREIKRSHNIVPKGKIYRHVSKIIREYRFTEQEVVYLFLRLWFFKDVKNFNFIKAFNDCEGVLLNLWLARYMTLVKTKQEDLIIV